MLNETIKMLLDGDVFIHTLIAFGAVSIVGIKTLGGVLRSSGRERTRREIAAYIAEGSLTAEQGERLMRSGESTKC